MDLLDAHDQARDVFDRAMRKVGLTDWDSPTPCSAWTVRDLVNHIVNEQLWVPDLLAGHTIEDVGDKYDGDQLRDDPMLAWTESSEVARAAWHAPDAVERDVHLSFGTVKAPEYGWQLTTDLAVHGWDLATALGADPGISDELATTLIGFIEPQISSWSASSMFADPVAVPDDADPATRLVGMLGRQQ